MCRPGWTFETRCHPLQAIWDRPKWPSAIWVQWNLFGPERAILVAGETRVNQGREILAMFVLYLRSEESGRLTCVIQTLVWMVDFASVVRDHTSVCAQMDSLDGTVKSVSTPSFCWTEVPFVGLPAPFFSGLLWLCQWVSKPGWIHLCH